MLTDKNTGIQKFILDQICRIHEEIVGVSIFGDPVDARGSTGSPN